MMTASQQGVGGATAGAVGAGNLLAARRGNAAGLDAALDDAARAGMRQNSENALKTTAQVQEAGMGGLQKLYGVNTEAAMKSLGLSDEAYRRIAQRSW
jgi:hypothetical protein